MRMLSRLRKAIKRLFVPKATPTTQHRSQNRSQHHRRKERVHVNSTNQMILGMVNRERRNRHLAPVVFDTRLEHHAIKWSRHMASQRRLSHSGDILENSCMVPNRGSPVTITRNMFYCWKRSRPHWNWMMDPNIHKAGFGFTTRGRYAYGAYAFE